jgi:hypothetical protein
MLVAVLPEHVFPHQGLVFQTLALQILQGLTTPTLLGLLQRTTYTIQILALLTQVGTALTIPTTPILTLLIQVTVDLQTPHLV